MGAFAWVTLATNDSYSLGALVLAHSLKHAGTAQQLVVLITPGVTNAMREKLSEVFNVVQEVNILDSKDETNLRLLKRPELGITFTKLHCWRLTQFEKCVFLDADTLVLQNCDELFEREELSAAPDVGWPDCFNSGVFVFRPSNETYEKLVQFAIEKGSFDGGDQGLLNSYFSDWAHKDISKHLPFIYNMSSTASYSYLPAFKQFGTNAKIIHFIGTSKPWLQYFDSESKKVHHSAGLQHLSAVLQRWWDIFCSLIHPNLSSEMAGLAGALAQVTLGAPRTEEQNALEDHLRKQCWEVGNIDYLGKDSFENIWNKICQTLAIPPQTTAPEVPIKQEEPITPRESIVLSAEVTTSENIPDKPVENVKKQESTMAVIDTPSLFTDTSVIPTEDSTIPKLESSLNTSETLQQQSDENTCKLDSPITPKQTPLSPLSKPDELILQSTGIAPKQSSSIEQPKEVQETVIPQLPETVIPPSCPFTATEKQQDPQEHAATTDKPVAVLQKQDQAAVSHQQSVVESQKIADSQQDKNNKEQIDGKLQEFVLLPQKDERLQKGVPESAIVLKEQIVTLQEISPSVSQDVVEAKISQTVEPSKTIESSQVLQPGSPEIPVSESPKTQSYPISPLPKSQEEPQHLTCPKQVKTVSEVQASAKDTESTKTESAPSSPLVDVEVKQPAQTVGTPLSGNAAAVPTPTPPPRKGSGGSKKSGKSKK